MTDVSNECPAHELRRRLLADGLDLRARGR